MLPSRPLVDELNRLADIEYLKGDADLGFFIQKLAYSIKVRFWRGKPNDEVARR
jgi:hypothetical protein